MTAVTTTPRSDSSTPVVGRLRRTPLGIRDMATALAARWHRLVQTSQLGPDDETVIGRNSGARV